MSEETTNPEDELDLRTRLNLECGQISWKEIEILFARGMVMYVAPQLDLIEVAALTAWDDADQIKAWTEQGQVGALTAKQAKDWQSRNPALWSVVVAPWAFVQERAISH